MKTANEYEYSGKEDIQIIKPNMSNAELSKSLSVFILESHFHRTKEKKGKKRRKKEKNPQNTANFSLRLYLCILCIMSKLKQMHLGNKTVLKL